MHVADAHLLHGRMPGKSGSLIFHPKVPSNDDIEIVMPFCLRLAKGEMRIQANELDGSPRKSLLLSRGWRETLWHVEAIANATTILALG